MKCKMTVAAALVVTVAVGACGGSSAKAKAGPTTSGSRVSSATTSKATSNGNCPVTDDDVKGATGASSVVSGAPHGGYPGATTCAWYLGDKSAGQTISVSALKGGRSAFQATAHAPNGDELADGSPYERVADLGDQATASGVGGDVNLDVIRRDDWLNVTSFSYGTDASRKTAKGLSTDALGACTKLARTALAKSEG
jgi:hypothetical protein